MGGEANKGRTAEAPFRWGPFEELYKMCLRTVLSVRGLGHLSRVPPAEGTPKKAYFLLPGCVDFFGLKETSEAEKQEPLPLSLEVG